MFNFNNKKVLVTGGSRGIGASCVKMFSDAGAEVYFTYSSNKKSAKELIKSCNGQVRAFQLDFNNKNLEEEIKKIIKKMKGIDILVNNAGIWKHSLVETMTLKEWDETQKINMTSTFLFSKYAAQFMKEKQYGKIINVSSTAGQRGEAEHSHYAASKGAMISFTKALAAELGPYNINVNSVAPGWVFTDMTSFVFDDMSYKDEVINNIPIRRLPGPEDIAGPIIFLASDLAKHITGEILNVNGGSVLCG